MNVKGAGLDLHTASSDEIIEAMRRGVRAALRHHKQAGVPAVIWDDEAGKIVSVPPDQIPDYPDDENDAVGVPNQ